MIQVASSFSMEPSLDVVLSSIPVRIYEAIQYLKENMDSFTAKVRHYVFILSAFYPARGCAIVHPEDH